MEQDCKRCLLYESAQNDILVDIKSRINKFPENERVTEDVYNSRLAKCKECDHLISGVCMKCGCYAEFRAAFKKQKCPDASGRKW